MPTSLYSAPLPILGLKNVMPLEVRAIGWRPGQQMTGLHSAVSPIPGTWHSACPASLGTVLLVVTPAMPCCKVLRHTLVSMQVDLHCAWLEELLLGREEGSPRSFDEVSSYRELRQVVLRLAACSP